MSKIECESCHKEYEDNEDECPRCRTRNPKPNRGAPDDDGNFLSPGAGQVGLDVTGGGLAIGLGSGLSMDLDDGGLNIGGIGLDGD